MSGEPTPDVRPGDDGWCAVLQGPHCPCLTEDNGRCCRCDATCLGHCVCWGVTDDPCCYCGEVNPANATSDEPTSERDDVNPVPAQVAQNP